MAVVTRDGLALEEDLPVAEVRSVVAARAGTDHYPDPHAVGVAECALRIADQLRLGPRVRRAVIEGALYHDVGKLLVDPSIIAKAGPLTAEERQEVNTHPVRGERLVRGAVDMSVGEVVRSHHERWDGAGYPHGLSADGIPLAARVVAVADAFLAMLEQRPYRTALTRRAALDELSKCAGSQFDPTCVRALITVESVAASTLH